MSGSELLGPLFASAKMRTAMSDADLPAAHARRRSGPRARRGESARYSRDRACGQSPPHVRQSATIIAALGKASADAGNLAIPLVKALTAEVAKRDRNAARFVHWGATSQDIIDTATVLGLREASALLERDLARAIRGFVSLAKKHRSSVMPGRTWLQHASPTVFGLKAAEYAASLARARTRMIEAVDAASVIQFGGASGTLAALKNKGRAVAKALGNELDLADTRSALARA